MHRIFQILVQQLMPLVRRAPTLRLGSDTQCDWLPPVLGPSDWSSGLMASMVDRSAAWYFDRAG